MQQWLSVSRGSCCSWLHACAAWDSCLYALEGQAVQNMKQVVALAHDAPG